MGDKLKIEYVSIDSIMPYARNAKLHPQQQVEQIKRSIQDYGMNDPIGVWHNEIVEGHGRLMACKELGITEVPIIRLEHMSDERRLQMNDKWVCGVCGRVVTEKPKRNVICNVDGCKGRFHHYRQCKCGTWFRCREERNKYCSINCGKRAERVTVKCDYCGNELTRKKSEIKKNKRVFCNKDCMVNYFRGEKLQRKCEMCGSVFDIYKSTLTKSNASGRFCSRKCYDEYQKTLTGEKNIHYTSKTVPCTVCGKDVVATPYRIKHTQNIFCSRECFREYFHNYVEGEKNAHWKGGHAKYRGDFERVKRKHFSKIQFCALCGTTRRINIHHIIPYRLTQDNSLDNLIPLCASHHKKVETFTAPIYENWEDKDMAKDCLNIILRARQKTTQAAVYKLLMKRKRENEKRICDAEGK